jgi:hypothetical protein
MSPNPTDRKTRSLSLSRFYQELERKTNFLKEKSNTALGFLIFLILPLIFVFLDLFKVLNIPLWMDIILWALCLLFISGIALQIISFFSTRNEIKSIEEKIDTLTGFKSKHESIEYINELVEINVSRLDEYYNEVKRHTVYSFSVALIVGIVGFLLIFIGIIIGYMNDNISLAAISGASGIITEFISGVFFYLYNKTVKQLKMYHDNLIQLQNILLSLQLIERIKDPGETYKVIDKVIDYLIGQKLFTGSDLSQLDDKK